MTIYRANNAALPATTAVFVGQSYAAGAKCGLQIGVPSGQAIRVVGYGITCDEDPTAATAQNAGSWEIVANATATTGLTAHSTTTIKPYDEPLGRASSMTMGTAATGYGAVAITTATPTRFVANGFIPPTSGTEFVFPSDMRPYAGQAGAAEFLQFRVNTVLASNIALYLLWIEL